MRDLGESYAKIWPKMAFAELRHVNFLARARPRFLCFLAVAGLSTSSTARVSEIGSSGSISMAALPTTSGIAEVLLAITGQPQAIASSGGMPKPS